MAFKKAFYQTLSMFFLYATFGAYGSVLQAQQMTDSTQLLPRANADTTACIVPLPNISSQDASDDEVHAMEKKKMDKADYIPVFHGTVRSRFEYQPEMHKGRFSVRTARVSIQGNVLPILGYKAEIDLSDQGAIKMLDAYIRVFPVKGLSLTLGQMRVPFTIDAHRGPHVQFFANRSFIAKQAGNVRDVGFTVAYTLPIKMPISLEAGMYNGKGIVDQKKAWTKDFCYSGKASFGFVDGLNLTLSAQTIKPEQVRMNTYDAGIYYAFWRFHVEAEYLYKQYWQSAFRNAQAVNSFIIYNQPLPKVFDCMSFLARYDYMTNHWNGIYSYDEEGMPYAPTTDGERHRLTAGVTLSMRPLRHKNGQICGVFREASKDFQVDLRVNYEKYFYTQPTLANANELDKLTIELMLHF